MKSQADKKHTERVFAIGDSIFVKLQPYVQVTVARRSNHKLSFRYFCPYKIVRIFNPVTYELDLPADSKLRRALAANTKVEKDLPVPVDAPLTPVEILDTRWRQTPPGRREQVLVS